MKRVLFAAGIVAVAVLAAVAFIAGAAYARAPELVAGLERSGALPFTNAARVPMIREKVQHGCAAGCFEGAAPVPCDASQAPR